MNDYKVSKSSLKALRDAANQDDWVACREAAYQVLSQLNRAALQDLIFCYLSYYQKIVLSKYVELPVPEALDSKAHIQVLYDLAGQIAYPGIGGFRSSLRRFLRFLEIKDDREQLTEKGLDTLSALFMGLSTYYWGTRYPHMWQLFLSDKALERRQVRLFRTKNRAVKHLHRKLWRGLADYVS